MSTLNSLFDVVRGWPDSSTIEETFVAHSSVPANNPLVEGDIVYQMGDGTVARASAAVYAGLAVADLITALTTDKNLWLIVSGSTAQNYDGLKQGNASGQLAYIPWKVVAIRGTYMFETEEFEAGAYVPADGVTVIAGKLARIPTDNPGYRKYAEVHSYDSARSVLTVCV